MSKAKLYKLTNIIISTIVAALAIFYLVDLFLKKTETLSILDISYIESSLFYLVIFTLLLMPINWLIEAYKWSTLTRRIQYLDIKKTIQSILIGVLGSLISPNRIGELGGRLAYIKKENLFAVLYTNMTCSLSQLIITIDMGLIVLMLNEKYYIDHIPFTKNILVLIGIFFLIGINWLFFSSRIMYRVLQYLSSRLQKSTSHILSNVSTPLRIKALFLSLLRYLVFATQFVLLLYFFGSELSILDSFSGIAIVFIVLAIVPTAWISDLPVRTSIAYFIFELFFQAGVPAMLSSIILWIINLLIPALLGLTFLPKINWLALKQMAD